jgi:phage gp36-like protein
MSLDAASQNRDASGALKALDDAAREIQGRGWEFNTERGYTLSPDVGTGVVQLPTNCIRTLGAYKTSSGGQRLFVRQRKFYDNKAHTFNIGAPVYTDMVVALPYEDLPENIKTYVVAMAAYRWCRPKLPSGAVFQYTEQYLADAESRALQAEWDDLGQPTLKETSPHFARFARRSL